MLKSSLAMAIGLAGIASGLPGAGTLASFFFLELAVSI
jgi:hypothetical protein